MVDFDVWPRACFGTWQEAHPTIQDLPRLVDWIGPAWQPEDLPRILAYLWSAPTDAATSGPSHCLFGCRFSPPALVFSRDDAWCWDSNLVHYVQIHNVRLPNAMVEHMVKRNFIPPGLARQ